MIADLSPELARIFRITHRDNVPWILDHGLHCKNSEVVDPNFVQIGNPQLIDLRSTYPVRHEMGGVLSDYVPFYFTSKSPMFLNIKTGWKGLQRRENEEIVILVSSLHRLREGGVPFIFSDRHAKLNAAQYFTDLVELNRLPWDALRRHDFKSRADDPQLPERYEAEALIHRRLPIDSLGGIVCYNQAVVDMVKAHVNDRGMAMRVVVNRSCYF